ncbi:MAG: general secretion pathway protein GspB [Caldimonas sp.]
MSYILDALRRADAERERGEVPSLRTQQYGALPGDDHVPRPPRLLLTVIVVLVLALGSTLAWNFWGGNDAGHRQAAQGTVAATAPPPVIAAPPALAAVPVPSVAPALAPLSPAVASPTPDVSRRLDAAAARVAARATARERRRATHVAAASAPASGAETGLGKLPEALRRELPALAFGGASYSSDAASRMVIFNGRVFHEGDTIAPQLVLQQIKLKAAVLAYKGYRYEMAY